MFFQGDKSFFCAKRWPLFFCFIAIEASGVAVIGVNQTGKRDTTLKSAEFLFVREGAALIADDFFVLIEKKGQLLVDGFEYGSVVFSVFGAEAASAFTSGFFMRLIGKALDDANK